MARGRGRRGPRSTNHGNWEVVKENQAWEDYYKAQKLIPEDEFEQFKAACQAPLPMTLRVTGTRKHALDVKKSMVDDYFSEVQNITWEGQKVEAPQPIKFYPDDLAWEVKVGKQTIRKNAEFSRLQKFLVMENSAGNISRQEAVSMIPPLLLDVKPHHSVLDMCAAPGSKTAQIVEAIHAESSVATGFVIANDSDYKRSHMLIHQVKRLNSPNFVVTNHDAQFYPRIKLPNGEFHKFDRVLCDVPCAGDGTMRKNIMVWKEWGVGAGLGLHPIQVNILLRGLQLLKPGGRLVYSTCSMNPIENESVVAEALRHFKGKAVLVDALLPNLVHSKGVSSWKVMGKDKQWKEGFEKDSKLPRSVFPPSEEEAASFHLDRCIRVYPHQQDTGGFFITVFEVLDSNSSVKPTQTEDSKEESKDQQKDEAKPESSEPPRKKQKKENLPLDVNEEPFKFLPADHPDLELAWKFYGVSDKFNKDCMLVRNSSGEPVRSIYYVSPALKPILQENENRLKFVNAGIKTFGPQKTEGACKWRIQSEGIEIMSLYTDDSRKVHCSNKETLKFLCLNTFPKFDTIEDELFNKEVAEKEEGCLILSVPDDDGSTTVYPLWKGKTSVNLMLPKELAHELLFRVFHHVVVEDKKAKIEDDVTNGDAKDNKTEKNDSITATPTTEAVAETTAAPASPNSSA